MAELTKRYFASRGPATLQDFVYWSGLTMKEAKASAAMLKSHFMHEAIDGREHIFAPITISKKSTKPSLPTDRFQTTFLMPDYDEYGMSYKNRSALLGTKNMSNADPYSHWLVVDGQIVGTWQRVINGKAVVVETTSFRALSKAKSQAVNDAVKRYTFFVGKGQPTEN